MLHIIAVRQRELSMSIKTPLTRRSFLQLTGGAAAAASLPSSVSFAQDTPNRVDVAVVGGGMAGLYCAYRLLSETDVSVALFEASDRVGGRVLSVQFDGFEHLPAEKGAMRLPSTDKISLKLVRTLLGPTELIPFDYPTTGYFLRDRQLSELSEVDALPYLLAQSEKNSISSGANLVVQAINRLAQNPAALKGHGLRELLIAQHSREGFHFIQDSTGYESVFSNWDASAAVDWFIEDFAPDTEYLAVPRGLERIPIALAAACLTYGGTVSVGHKLSSIARAGQSRFSLGISGPNVEFDVIADQVVMALPPASFSDIDDQEGLFDAPDFQAAISSVTPETLAKIHMAFDTAWWKDEGLGRGRRITDLPLRQSYIVGEDEKTGRGLLMASYHDGSYANFWRSLMRGPHYRDASWLERAYDPEGRNLKDSIQRQIPATELLAAEALRQTQALYGLEGPLPEPAAVTYRDWSVGGVGAGWHQWAIGTDPEATMAYLRNPVPGMHVCGEAWSRGQGWIIGAVDTAEAMLTEQFGLSSFV